MKRRRTRARIATAAEPILLQGEQVAGAGAVWMADRRQRVPLLLTGRAIYLVALTNQRLLVFDTPRPGRPLLESDLLLHRRLDALPLLRVRTKRPMLQLLVQPSPDRQVALEFRPRDRKLARAIAAALPHAPHPTAETPAVPTAPAAD